MVEGKNIFICEDEQLYYFLQWYPIMCFLKCVALEIAAFYYEIVHLILSIYVAVGLPIRINIASRFD